MLPALALLANPAFWGGASSAVGAAGGIASMFGLGGKDKVPGVPKPPTGQEMGVDNRNYMDESFPGTTPQERLGVSSPIGSVASAGVGAQADISAQNNANRLQRNQLNMERMRQAIDVGMELWKTKASNRASVISSTAGLGLPAMDAALSRIDGSSMAPSRKATPSYKGFFSLMKKNCLLRFSSRNLVI